MEHGSKVTYDEFLALTERDNGSECEYCSKQDFLGWENIPFDHEEKFELRGRFEHSRKYIREIGYSEYHPDGTNYWSKDAPVAVAYYPYNGSEIRSCPECEAIFLQYTEYQGHGPQNRLRWVRRHLIHLAE